MLNAISPLIAFMRRYAFSFQWGWENICMVKKRNECSGEKSIQNEHLRVIPVRHWGFYSKSAGSCYGHTLHSTILNYTSKYCIDYNNYKASISQLRLNQLCAAPIARQLVARRTQSIVVTLHKKLTREKSQHQIRLNKLIFRHSPWRHMKKYPNSTDITYKCN